MDARKSTTDYVTCNENLTYDELLSAFVEMKKVNARLEQEAKKLTYTLDRQASEISDLKIEKNDDIERINFLCDIMTDLEVQKSTLEASLKGSMPVKNFTNSVKTANQPRFSLLKIN